MRGFRPLSRIAHPSLMNSYFLAAQSSVNKFNFKYLHFFFLCILLNRKV